MERLYSFLLTVLFSLPLFAVDFTDGDFKFSANADGTTCTVTGSTLTSGDLIIPSEATYNNKILTVTDIGEKAFLFSRFESLTLPSTLKTIGKSAFSGAEYKGELKLPEGLAKIGEMAFHGCRYLTGDLVIPTSVEEIGEFAFNECHGITGTLYFNAENCADNTSPIFNGVNFSRIVVGDKATNIPSYFLDGIFSKNHTGTLSIGKNVKTIGAYAFRDCSGLTGNLIIPDNVISIGEDSFNGCSGFNGKLYIGSKVESIGDWAFSECSGLIGDLVIPNSVKTIGNFAFHDCVGFDGILSLGTGLRNLGRAFVDCSGLKGDLVIPEGITQINQNAFQNCTGMDGILILPPTLTGIGTIQFYSCKFTDIVSMNTTPPAYIGEAGSHAFSVENYKATLYVPDESIDDYKASDVWSPFYAILPLSELNIPATSVSVSNTNLELLVGESAMLTATVNPYYATDRSVVWSSANNSVATVDSDGKVTALKAGSVVITATTANGLTSNCVVNVVAKIVDATAVVLNIENAELEEGESVQLTATITPSDATDKTISWVSGNPSIAIVDTNGKVTAVKTGSIIITASTSNGLKATCIITVTPRIISPSSLTLNLETAEIEDGESVQLTATVTPDNATDKSVSWSTSDASIATVDASGKVSGVKEGSVNITAKTANGLTATCKVTVKAKADSAIDGVESDGIFVSAENGVIVISAPEDAVADVFAITGVKLRSTTEHRISGLAHGMYIVRIGNIIRKVIL
jgi:uncharacterized protein YjdB